MKRGYQKGTPDIIILNPNKEYNGFAIELKTPNGNGVLSENQRIYIKNLEIINYKTLISNNYDNIILNLCNYFQTVRTKCLECNKMFSKKRYEKHNLVCDL